MSIVIALEKLSSKYFGSLGNTNETSKALVSLKDTVDTLSKGPTTTEIDPTDSLKPFITTVKSMFEELLRVLLAMKSDLSIINDGKDLKSFKSDSNLIGMKIIALIDLYGNMIHKYAIDMQNDVQNAKDMINRRKESFNSKSSLNEIIDRAISIIDEDVNEPSSVRVAKSIVSMFDKAGDIVNYGIDVLGKQIGYLFIRLGKGTEEIAYSTKVISDRGFDAFLEDPRCMDTVRNTVIYSIIFLIIWSIVKSIFRRIGSIFTWIGS